MLLTSHTLQGLLGVLRRFHPDVSELGIYMTSCLTGQSETSGTRPPIFKLLSILYLILYLDGFIHALSMSVFRSPSPVLLSEVFLWSPRPSAAGRPSSRLPP